MTLNTTHPDVTECFQNTVLSWTPCGFLLVTAPCYISYLLRSKRSALSHGGINVTKTVSLPSHTAPCYISYLLRSKHSALSHGGINVSKTVSPPSHQLPTPQQIRSPLARRHQCLKDSKSFITSATYSAANAPPSRTAASMLQRQ